MSNTDQELDPFNGRLERAVLESAAPAIDRSLSMYYVETIRSMPQDRLIRISHPTALSEEVYVLVTAEVVTHEVAKTLMSNAPAREAREGGAQPKVDDFRVGAKYRIQYELDGLRVPRESVVVYLGMGLNGLAFDARPQAGTLTIPISQMTEAAEVPEDATVYVGRRVKRHSTLRTSDKPLG